ncbi:PH domain-containing protein [Natrinema caseinilyticum]|uniref:PH domain-containing protein n=1 Tax=Natrinema caseinilyticum TaxID=2961570 RepID=UPI003CCD4AA9
MQYTISIGIVFVVAIAATVTTGFHYWYGPLLLLPLAPVAAHVKWANLGYHIGDHCFVVRSGFWNRTTRIVPYFRFQSGSVKQTVFQRRWKLASFIFDTASATAVFDRSPTVIDVHPHDARCIHNECRSSLQDRLSNPQRQRYGLKERVER